MSIELYILLADSRVPTRAAWQEAIEQVGFPTVLDPTLDVRKHSGFLPALYNGEETGFEYSLEPAAEILSFYPHLSKQAGGRDATACFRWGGDLTEMAAALSAAAALAKLTDGLYYYADDDLLYNADEALEATRKDLSSG